MAGILRHEGKIAILLQDDVDTDRIIPARFLSMVTKSGYGELLFKDVRGDGFPLDDPAAQGASILVVGTNFGCGSSREHAVWAIQQGGFQAVVAKKTDTSPGYSDIFRSNSANCGLALIELDEAAHQAVVNSGTGATLTVDIENLTVTTATGTFPFEMAPATQRQLMLGLDLVGMTLENASDIDRFEQSQPSFIKVVPS